MTMALVTGASGFIGAHVVAVLADRGARVRAFARDLPRIEALPDDVEFVHGDVLDADAVRQAMHGCDVVFHLAALYSYARRDAAQMHAVNVRGTRNVLDAALRGRRRRIVFTSSCATCGPIPGTSATERDLPPPRELNIPYKRTKLEAERLTLEAAREGADAIVVNPTVPVGPGDLRPTPTGKMVADVARWAHARISRWQCPQRRGSARRRARPYRCARARALRRALPARRGQHGGARCVCRDRPRGRPSSTPATGPVDRGLRGRSGRRRRAP